MLVNPVFLWENIGHVAALSGLVVFGKLLIVLVLSLFFPQPLRTFVVIAIGLSQVGEFSFILGQAGLSLGLMTSDQYSLILAASLISITVNPFMYKLAGPLENFFSRMPLNKAKARRHLPPPLPLKDELHNHVVIIGYERVGKHLVDVLSSLKVPMIVVEENMDLLDQLIDRNIPALFGDASNSEVLKQTHLEHARILVSTIVDETTATMIVTYARDLAPNLTIIANSSTQDGVKLLEHLGANFIIQPELEAGLELVNHTLLELGFPLREVHAYARAFRRDHYNPDSMSSDEHRTLNDLLVAFNGIETCWFSLSEHSPILGKTLAQADIRAKTGASVVALIRDGHIIPNPKSQSEFQVSDKLGLIGEKEQIEAARALIHPDIEEVQMPAIDPA
jgi:CPA2 family monovalent cation:H+ antiporter-2